MLERVLERVLAAPPRPVSATSPPALSSTPADAAHAASPQIRERMVKELLRMEQAEPADFAQFMQATAVPGQTVDAFIAHQMTSESWADNLTIQARERRAC